MRIRKFLFSAALAVTSIATLSAASSFSGKARMRLGINELYNYSNEGGDESGSGFNGNITYGLLDKSEFEAKFMLEESTKSSKGKDTSKAYAQVEAYAKIRSKMHHGAAYDTWLSLDNLKYRVGFTKADIVFKEEDNFKLSILGKSPMNRYARGWEIALDGGQLIGTEPFVTNSTALARTTRDLYAPKNDIVTGKHSTQAVLNRDDLPANYLRARGGYMPTMALSYSNYSLVFGLDGGTGGNKNLLDTKGSYNSKEKPDYIVLAGVDDLKLSKEVAFSLQGGIYNSNRMVLGSVYNVGKSRYDGISIGQQTHALYGGKFAYKTEKLSFEAGATGNVRVNKGGAAYTDVDEANAVEASLNIAYHDDVAVSFDAWFLDNQALWSNENQPDDVVYDNRSDLGYVYRDKFGNIYSYEEKDGTGENNRTLHKALSMRLKVKPVKDMSTVITAQDVLNQGIYGIQVPVKLNDKFTVTPAFEYTIDTSKTYQDGRWERMTTSDANSIWDARLECDLKDPNVYVSGSLRFGKESLGDGIYIKPYLSISSRTLVNGVQLSLIWKNATFGTATIAPSQKFHVANTVGNAYVEARINFK